MSRIMDPWTGTIKENHWKVINYRIINIPIYPARPPDVEEAPTAQASAKLAALPKEGVPVAPASNSLSWRGLWETLLGRIGEWLNGLG